MRNVLLLRVKTNNPCIVIREETLLAMCEYYRVLRLAPRGA